MAGLLDDSWKGIKVYSKELAAKLEKDRNKEKYFESYPAKKIIPAKESGYYGRIDKTIPSEIELRNIANNPEYGIDSKYYPLPPYQTFEHERQHLLTADRTQKGETSYPLQDYTEGAKLPAYTKYANKSSIAENPESTRAHLNNIRDVYAKKRFPEFLADDFTGTGFFPEIRRIEASLPKGTNLLDTEFGQDVFNRNPELLDAYFSMTRPQNTTSIKEDVPTLRSSVYKNYDPYAKKNNDGIMSMLRNYIKKSTIY